MYEYYSKEQLFLLANDKHYYVRCEVAFNPNTPPEVLERLANDNEWYVRRWVANNPSTPQYIRTYLKIKEFLNYYE
jgi:hypothetical protein